MFMLISNKPIEVADPQKSANQLMLNGALVTEMVNNSLSESKKKKKNKLWSFDKARDVLQI